MRQRLAECFARFSSLSLRELDERAALQRRVDNKYVVSASAFEGLVESLLDGHEVLEIDGHRLFEYENVYFDTPALACFHDHVAGRRPRYKARSRYYATTDECFFEVKVKTEDEQTSKDAVRIAPPERETVTEEGSRLLERKLADAGLGGVPPEFGPALMTAFERVTMVSAESSERCTVDLGVRLCATDGGGRMEMDEDRLVVEAKSADGESTVDRLLQKAGAQPISFSKYRFGVGALRLPGTDEEYGRGLRRLFRVQPG